MAPKRKPKNRTKNPQKEKYVVEHFMPLAQAWGIAGGKKKIPAQPTLEAAQREAARMVKGMAAFNIKADKDLRPWALGSDQIPHLRVVKYVGKTRKAFYPGTKEDAMFIKKQPELEGWFKI